MAHGDFENLKLRNSAVAGAYQSPAVMGGLDR